jgi:hypothetical protein
MHMPRLLTNTDFREQCLEQVNEPQVVEFFHDRYDRWGKEAPLMRESTLNKIGAFSLNPRLKLMLGQQANHLDFRAIMDEGKTLLLDLGRSDGETNRLIGSLKVIFGIGRHDAEHFARLIGRVDAEAVKRDPKTETQHELFSSLSEQWEQWANKS